MGRTFTPIETAIQNKKGGFERLVGDSELLLHFVLNDVHGDKFRKYVKETSSCPLHESQGMCTMVDDIPSTPGSQDVLRKVSGHEAFFVCKSPQDKKVLEQWVMDNWESIVYTRTLDEIRGFAKLKGKVELSLVDVETIYAALYSKNEADIQKAEKILDPIKRNLTYTACYEFDLFSKNPRFEHLVEVVPNVWKIKEEFWHKLYFPKCRPADDFEINKVDNRYRSYFDGAFIGSSWTDTLEECWEDTLRNLNILEYYKIITEYENKGK